VGLVVPKQIRRAAALALLTSVVAFGAQAQPIDSAAVLSTENDAPVSAQQTTSEPTSVEFDDAALANAFNVDFLSTSASKPKPLRRFNSDLHANWNKTVNDDGSATYSVNRPLAAPWDAKIGADISTAPPSPASYEPRQLPGTTTSAGSGSAWANVAVPDVATVEVRAEPANDYDKVGTKLERSLPLGKSLSMTMQGSVGFTELRAPTITQTVSNALPSARQFDTDKSVQLNILPTGTTLLAGSSTATGDPVTHRRLSAAQKIYGPLSITGSVYDVGQPTSSASITAGLNFTW
jgi:hypothetical protein